MATMPWFRVHRELFTRPKTKRMTRRFGKELGWELMQLWGLASLTGGDLPPVEDVGIWLDLAPTEAQGVLDRLIESEFIDEHDGTLRIHDWEEWQAPKSPRSGGGTGGGGALTDAERTRRYRERKKAEGSASPAPLAVMPQPPRPSRAESDQLVDAFDLWIDGYPNRKQIDQAARNWISLIECGEITAANLQELFAGLKRWVDSAEWSRDGGKFVPSPAVFLMGNERHSGRMWKDNPPPSAEAVASKRDTEWRPDWDMSATTN